MGLPNLIVTTSTTSGENVCITFCCLLSNLNNYSGHLPRFSLSDLAIAPSLL